MSAGSNQGYGALNVQIRGRKGPAVDAHSMQVLEEKNGLESKLCEVLSLLDPSTTTDFTNEVAEKQRNFSLSTEQAIQEVRADKIVKHFEKDGNDPVAQMMTDWFDTFESAVVDVNLLPGFEKQMPECPGISNVKDVLTKVFLENEADCGVDDSDKANYEGEEYITYKQWTTTARAELISVTATADEYVEILCEKLDAITAHSYIATSQSNYLEELKENLKDSKICRVSKIIIDRAYEENKKLNEGKEQLDQSYCKYSLEVPFTRNGQTMKKTILQLCGDGFQDRTLNKGSIVEKYFGFFERRRPYTSYKRDFTPIAECILKNDISALNTSFDPIVSALEYRNDNLASLFIQRTSRKSRIRLLFEHQGKHKQKISFKDIIEDRSMKKTVLAVLDCLVSEEAGFKVASETDEEEDQRFSVSDDPVRYHFYFQVLDGDANGRPPLRREMTETMSPAKALIEKKEFTRNVDFNLASKSCLQVLCQSEHKVAVCHPVVRTLAQRKWEMYGERRIRLFALGFAFYILFLVVGLLLAAAAKDPRSYSASIDKFRGICEVITVLATMLYLFLEVDQCWKASLQVYRKDFSNWVDVFGILTLLSLIPLRYLNVSSQWIVASVSCILNFMRIYKYFAASRLVSVYAKTLAILVKKDLVIFGIFYTFILIMFCSAIFLALRAVTGSNGFAHVDVSGFADILFRELRSLAQSDPFSSEYRNYKLFSIILIMVSMFVTMVFMVNLLIAQLSSTYDEATKSAAVDYDIAKALFSSQLDNSRLTWWNPRLTYYTPGSYEHNKNKVKELIESWESVKDAKLFI